MGIHVGVNGTPKEVVGVYVGVNGTPKECSDVYVGVNGTPKSCYSGVKPGETIFTSSSTFTVPRGVKKIDVFCVGGGGSTGGDLLLGGGAGGYTSTKLGVSVTPGQQLSVTVGSAGAGGFNNRNEAGGTSSVGDICSANGGYNGGSGAVFGLFNSQNWVGGFGGSGGGCGDGAGSFHFSGIGGKDGGDGSGGTWYNGKGQGTTTRYFGESTGTLYSTGGCGWSSNGAASGGWYNGNEAANTGNGASCSGGYDDVFGGSGIAIIRWDDQKS